MQTKNTGLEVVDDKELKTRFDLLMTRLHSLCVELAPKMELIGKYRLESQIIYQELYNRGLVDKYEPPQDNVG